MLLTSLSLSCQRDPASVAQEADKSLRSWSATLDLARDEWTHHHVPDTYLRQVLTAADKALDQQQRKLKKLSPTQTSTAQSHLRALGRQIDDLRSALSSAGNHGGSA